MPESGGLLGATRSQFSGIRPSSRNPVAIREIPAGESLRSFIDVAWKINREDPFWIGPLRMTIRQALDRRKHPFHEHAEVACFLASRNGVPVGRIAATVNHRQNDYHSNRVGFFGLFECEANADTAGALLSAAKDWLQARGMTTICGPFNLSTNDEVSSPGVLIDGFESPPAIMMSHNPPYYAELLEAAGLERVRDLLAFRFDRPDALPERVVRSADRILARFGATVRPLDLRRFDRDLAHIKEIYNSAWSRNWGFVPMSDAEFDHLAREFRPFVDPALCLIVSVGDEPIGFSLALPDLNEAIRHLTDGRLLPFGFIRFLRHRRKIRSIRVLTLGFKPQYRHSGLGAALYLRTWLTGVEKGYVEGEGSWVLEDNHEIVRALERMGGKPYRRYAIFEGPI